MQLETARPIPKDGASGLPTSLQVYYVDEYVAIYHGDCREILPTLQADVVITDPPYDETMTGDLLRQWFTIGPVAVFGWPEPLVGLCAAAGAVPSEWVTWWPTNGACRGTNFAGLWRESEAIAIFGLHQFATLRQPRADSVKRFIAADYKGARQRGDSNGEMNTRRVGDVWTDAAPGLAFNSHKRLHPNEKPLAVMRRLVSGLTSEKQTIVDPFMGSGTTLRAAKDLGRRAIGIEIEERHCETAARRMSQGVMPLAKVLSGDG